MPPDESDVARLWEMLDAARKVVELTTGMTFEQYLEEWSKRWSIERAIEIVGEAGGRCRAIIKMRIQRFRGGRSWRNATCWRTSTAESIMN